MTIRKTLLVAFLLVSLLPSILLTYLAFHVAGDAMRSDIEHNLQVQAATVSQDIDKMLFERLQNAQTWHRLEVMQDIHINDVDKRLSKFLAELKVGYRDVYLELFCTNTEGRVVASSDPASIGSIRPQGEGILLTGDTNVPIRLGTLQLTGTDGSAVLPISANVPSMFNDGQIGELQLLFNWAQIYRILDQSAQSGHELALLDPDRRIIAASSKLRERNLLQQQVPANWIASGRTGIGTYDGRLLGMNEVMVGYDRSPGFQQFPGFSWTTLVIESHHQAFIPVRQMALVFLLLLALTSIVAIAFSLLVAGRIARPIAALTEFTRRFKRDQQLPEAPQAIGGEVGELTEAFVQTVRDLDQSRTDLVRASKLAVLGEMAAVMAHEIRTPIGILRSSAQMLAREPELRPEAQELTGFIESETERLNRLVSTLLDSARPRAPKLQPADLHAIIRHSIDLLAAQADKKNIHIHLKLYGRHPVIELDAEQMTQVLLNLVLNALQILPQGGQVEITTREDAGKLVLEIADDGPGIPPQELVRVFDPFFTKREGGVGLGLAVVQQIVAAHGGEIHAGNSALGGALFTITLPMKESS
ncbi:MAG TPA: ATP-binding protein [Methylophilaceae bacterium]|nr:ATP-binding protein [Methylophilaceae bacterium]HQR60228.1 ATP-binding protein [Methylophilaceae bacterium]